MAVQVQPESMLLQHVGLPVEIGVKAAHNALLGSGLRHQVEIWADGGMKSAMDVMKIMLLGANRVGFGTLSMLAIGCTTCRGCHLRYMSCRHCYTN